MACVVLLLAAMLAAIPLLVSTGPIRDRLASQISSAIGYRIELREAPEVSVFPSLNATLRGVVVSDWADKQAGALLEADAASVNLSLASAIRGKLDFSSIRLIKPRFHMDAISALERTGGIGLIRLKRDIEIAKSVIAENPDAPDQSRMPSGTLGTLTILNATFLSADREIASGVSGTISWPALNSPAAISLSGTLNDKAASLKADFQKPLVLLAGGTSETVLSLASDPFNLSFEGATRIDEQPFAEGSIDISTPSIPGFLKWAGVDLTPGAEIGKASVKGTIAGNAERFRLDNAIVELDGNPGKGAIEFALTESKPTISGSLDFASLDLASMLSSFLPLPTSTTLGMPLNTRFIDQLDLDLRLSAAQATAGSLSLSNVAASAQVQGGLASFDVNDAVLYGGRAQAALRVDLRDGEPKGEIRFGIEKMATADFARDLGMIRVAPQFTGQLSILARGSMKTWKSLLDTANGTFLFRGSEGRLGGLDWRAFLTQAGGQAVFNLWSVSEGETAVGSSQFQGKIESGVFRIENGVVDIGGTQLHLSGVMPFGERSLAMFARFDDPAKTTANGPSFFVGGSWGNPFISPVLTPLGAP